MSKQRVIIVGYPKSGNTWLTRLVAELLSTPVQGFLYSDHQEIAIEGEERQNNAFEVYKSHHQLHELSEEDRINSRIIYILRDPRDLMLSGTKYFNKFLRILPNDQPSNSRNKVRKATPTEEKVNSIYKKFFGSRVIRKRMTEAVLEGNEKVHHWCRISWSRHLSPYLAHPNVLKLSYESLLNDPLAECKRILGFLNWDLTEKQVEKAILNQSFSRVKKKFEEEKLADKAEFLRSGKAQQWKSELTQWEKLRFKQGLEFELQELGYD